VLTNLLVPALIAGAPCRVVVLSSAAQQLGDVLWDDINTARSGMRQTRKTRRRTSGGQTDGQSGGQFCDLRGHSPGYTDMGWRFRARVSGHSVAMLFRSPDATRPYRALGA